MRAVEVKSSVFKRDLSFVDLPRPAVGDRDLLVRVHVATVLRGDAVMLRMPKLLARLFGETPKSVLGQEFAGEVESVGSAVEVFQPGNRVFGTTTGLVQGSHAELLRIPSDAIVTSIPPGVDYEHAAAVPVGAMTALHFLDASALAHGDRVLINGASGGVGIYAVQIARIRGARVTGVAGPSNLELIRELGAEQVIDYTAQSLADLDDEFDVVFDVAGTTSARDSKHLLSPDGRFVTTQARRNDTLAELRQVRQLLADGLLKTVVDRRFNLAEVSSAFDHVKGGSKSGVVLIKVR